MKIEENPHPISEIKRIIAVDGPAGSGKSSVSKEVAKRLGLKYIDSGAMYRAITWFLLKKFSILVKGEDYFNNLKDFNIKQRFNSDGTSSTLVNDRDISKEIRNEIIANNIGIISDEPKIRCFVNGILRDWSRGEKIIMDGRDIGTVVFPDAEVKIFLNASVNIRTQRRYQEYKDEGKVVDENELKKQIIKRDEQDKSRSFGCLIKAKDAINIDTSNMSKEDVVQNIIRIISA